MQQAMTFLRGGGEGGQGNVLVLTWTLAVRHGADEAHESRATEELGHEHGRVSLCVCVLNPLQTWPENTRIAASLAQHATSIAAHDLLRRRRLLLLLLILLLLLPEATKSSKRKRRKSCFRSKFSTFTSDLQRPRIFTHCWLLSSLVMI